MRAGLVVITGGAKRIGASIAEKCAKEGHAVLITTRKATASSESFLAGLREFGVKAAAVEGDVSNEDEVQRMAKAICEHELTKEAGGITGLIHNASVFEAVDFADSQAALSLLKSHVSLHVTAPYLLTQGLLGPLKAAKGSVVGLTDTSHGRSWGELEHYTATKAGLRQLMINLAGSLGADGIRCNCVSPGYILKAESVDEDYDALLKKIPLARMGEPEDIANAVYFMLSSPYITGQVLAVDGGLSIS